MRPTRDRTAEDWFTPKQERARATVDALIEATIVELEQYGESGVRQERILANSGVAQGSLYHHFGNRDGLIDAAYTVILQRSIDALLAQLEATLTPTAGRASDPAADAVGDLLGVLLDETTTRSRTNQLVVLAAAVSRPGLQTAVQREQDRLINALAVFVTALQDDGAIRADLAPRDLAAFIHAVTFGRLAIRLCDDIDDGDGPDGSRPDRDSWCDFVIRTLSTGDPVVS